MDNSALNKAHLQQRRAECLLKSKKYSDAIECHQCAADLLLEALIYTKNTKAIESIHLQRSYHLRQKEIILIKKEQFENYNKAIENQKSLQKKVTANFEVIHGSVGTNLQVAIYKAMEDADSLIAELITKKSEEDEIDGNTDGIISNLVDGSIPVETKAPKQVIEELRTLNGRLHSLIYELANKLDASSRETAVLREKVKQLENERARSQIKSSTNNLKVVTDSSGATSPYVFSPCSETSPDVQQRVLPQLQPLELPNFDFGNFTKTVANLNDELNSPKDDL